MLIELAIKEEVESESQNFGEADKKYIASIIGINI